MSEQVGWRALVRQVQEEAPFWSTTLPQLPRLIHRALSEDRVAPLQKQIEMLLQEQRRLRRTLALVSALFILGATVTALLTWLC